MTTLMNRTDLEDFVFNSIDITPANKNSFETLLKLPYPIYIELIHSLKSGEVTIDALDQSLKNIEQNISPLTEIPDDTLIDMVKKNVGVSKVNEDPVTNMFLSSAMAKVNDSLQNKNKLVNIDQSEIKNKISKEFGVSNLESNNLILSGKSTANSIRSTELSNLEKRIKDSTEELIDLKKSVGLYQDATGLNMIEHLSKHIKELSNEYISLKTNILRT